MINRETLMERLRLQSIIQRLIKAVGRDQALETIKQAIELEFPEKTADKINKNARSNSSSS